MAKKDTDTVDDKVEDAQIPGGETELADEQQQEDTSVRGAIEKAMNEVEEKDDGGESRVSSDDSSRETIRRRAKTDEGDEEDNTQRSRARKEEKEEDKEEVSTDAREKEQKEEKLDPPPGYWNKKGREAWDKLDATTKKHIAAREKEVSDGFGQISQRLKSFDEIEAAIAPRAQVIQQFGVSPAQTIDRLFQWMEALSHQNPRLRANAFKQLANDFGVPLNQLISGGAQNSDSNSQNEGNEQQDSNEPPEWFQNYAQHNQEQINGVQQMLAGQRRAAAQTVVQNWGNAVDSKGEKLRPHFEMVAPLMARLSMPSTDERGNVIAPAIVPLVNGEVDLEAAYATAIKLHPEVAALVQQEAAEKAKKDAAEAAKKDAKAKAERLAKAQRAGSGLKPAAPSLGTAVAAKSSSKANGSRQPSVRDAIAAAIEQHRE